MNATDTASTHVAYFTRGGKRVFITQTMGEVLSRTDEALTVQSCFGRVITIPTTDVLAVKDGKLTDAEWDEILAEHGHEQRDD